MHKIEEHIISGFISGGLKTFATHGLSVNESSFSDKRCEKLFARIKALATKNRFFDLVVLSEEFKGDEDITPEYLVELSGLETFNFELPSMLQSHLDQLFKENLRKMVGGFRDKLPEDIITKLQATIWEYHSGRNFDWNLGDKLRETLEWIEEKGKGIIEYPFGLTAIDNLLGGLFRKELTVLAARPSCGKCLGKGTKILMYNGKIKKIENIKVGNLLMGIDSKPRKVLSLARGREEMYWVRQNKAIDYRVNKGHILSLKRSRTENCYKHGDVLNISVNEYLERSNKFKTNYKGYKLPVEFKEKELPIEPYFLGLWLADGTSSSVVISNPDKEIVEYLKEYAQRLGMIFHKTNLKDKTKCPMYSISSGKRGGSVERKQKTLQGKLRALGVLNNKHIPNEYLINSTKNRLLLLAGLLDGDGSKSSSGYEITQKRKKLSEQIKFLSDSLGFRTSLNSKIARIKSIGYECEVYRVLLYGDVDKIPIRIERKKSTPWNCKRSWNQTGIKVEYDKIDDYYGFELSGDGLFLLEDMTVTHNTSFAINLANNLINIGKKVLYIDLESGELSLLERFLSYRTKISGHRIHRGEVAQFEIQKLTKAASIMDKLPLVVNDQSGMTVGEINNQALCIGAECVIVDYLNLVGGGDPTNEVDRLGEITLGLHHMAKNLNIPVVLLAQLNRGVDHREDHRPRMSDLRGSGKIEEPADNILFLYWAYKYDSEELENVNELIVGKQRNGPIGAEQLSWQASHFAFGDLFKGEEDSGKRSESNAGSNNGVKQGDSSPKRKWARPLHQSAFGFGDAPEHGGGDAEHLLGRAPLEERRAVARLRGDISDNEGSDS